MQRFGVLCSLVDQFSYQRRQLGEILFHFHHPLRIAQGSGRMEHGDDRHVAFTLDLAVDAE